MQKKRKKETRQPTSIIQQNKLKIDKRLKCESQCHKSPREEHEQENFRYPHSNIFTDMCPRVRDIKETINK